MSTLLAPTPASRPGRTMRAAGAAHHDGGSNADSVAEQARATDAKDPGPALGANRAPADPIDTPPVPDPGHACSIDMYDPARTLAELQISDADLLALVNGGELAAYRLGGAVRFRRRDVDSLAQRR